MFKINCPFCESTIISDVVDEREGVNGQWQCPNGHTFLVKYIETVGTPEEGDIQNDALSKAITFLKDTVEAPYSTLERALIDHFQDLLKLQGLLKQVRERLKQNVPKWIVEGS